MILRMRSSAVTPLPEYRISIMADACSGRCSGPGSGRSAAGRPSQTNTTRSEANRLDRMSPASPGTSRSASSGGSTPTVWRTLRVSRTSIAGECVRPGRGKVKPMCLPRCRQPHYTIRLVSHHKRNHPRYGYSYQGPSRRNYQSDAPSLQETVREGGSDQGSEAPTVLREAIGTCPPRCPAIVRAQHHAAHASRAALGSGRLRWTRRRIGRIGWLWRSGQGPGQPRSASAGRLIAMMPARARRRLGALPFERSELHCPLPSLQMRAFAGVIVLVPCLTD